MAEAQLQQFLQKIQQLNAFVALTEAQPELRQALRDCSNHHDVVQLAAQFGFDIGRRWGDSSPQPDRPADQPNLLRGGLPGVRPGTNRRARQWTELAPRANSFLSGQQPSRGLV